MLSSKRLHYLEPYVIINVNKHFKKEMQKHKKE